MQCHECGADNPDAAKFCLSCGAPLALTCPQCGATLPPHAKFCSKCGARLAKPAVEPPPAPDAGYVEALQRLVPKEFAERLRALRGQDTSERRMVTILFCDVKGSTALAEGLDPEEFLDIMHGAFEFLISANGNNSASLESDFLSILDMVVRSVRQRSMDVDNDLFGLLRPHLI